MLIRFDGRLIISASADKSIMFWNTESGQVIETFRGHMYSVMSIALSGDGRRLVSGSNDKSVRLWEL